MDTTESKHDAHENVPDAPELRSSRWCVEHNVAALYDGDCFRCPDDNAVVGPVVR